MKYERITEKRKTPLTMSMWGGSSKDLRIYNRLAELEDKIEQGKMIELPCPIRTMVYYIASYEENNGFWGRKKYCTTIMEIPFELDMLDSYGNNWFLTREEAEKRLLELQREIKL